MANRPGPDVVAHFQSGFEALRRHPLLVVPPLAVQILTLVVMVLVFGGALGMGALMGGLMGGMMSGREGMAAGGMLGIMGGMLLFGILVSLIVGLLQLVAAAVVIVMARDALGDREPSVGEALRVVTGRLGDVVIASLLVMVAVGVGVVFLILPGVVAGFFLMFTLPAVLLDGEGAVAALRRSVRVVADNLGTALALAVGALLVGVVGWFAFAIVGFVPVLGHLAQAVLAAAVVSYLTLVAVSVYQALARP